MNKQELVDAVGDRLGDRRTAATAVDAVLDAVTAALVDGQRVALFGFGVFERVERAARTARNPATGGTVEVAATSVPRFRAGAALKKAVAGPATAPTSQSAEAAAGTDARPAKGTATTKAGKTGSEKAGKGSAKAGKGSAKAAKKGKGEPSGKKESAKKRR